MAALGDLRAELEDLIAGASGDGLAGLAVGIAHGDEELIVTHGVTNVEHPLEVDRRTLFQIGSTTKTFTGTAVMRLVEDGEVGLDDAVVTHVPDFRLRQADDTQRVTVRHLLTHAGGWSGDWFLLTEPDYGREGALARVVADMHVAPRLLAPGDAFSYNNAGFYVLGRILEVKTGLLYADAVRQLVLDPAGLTHSFFYADEMVTHRVAAGHTPSKDGPVVHRPWPRPFYAWPAGALNSCLDDQLAWARFWAGDGTGPSGDRVLKPETMTAMTEPQRTIDSESAVGLSWMLRDVGGTRVVEHGGATNGYLSRFAMVPGRRFAVAVLANSTGAAAINRKIERWALTRVLDLAESESLPLPTDADPAEYVGRYGLGPDAGWANTIELDDEGVLTLVGGSPPGSAAAQAPAPRYRLVLAAGDEVVVSEPAAAAGLRGTFGRSPDGKIAWVRFGLRVYNRL